MTYLTEKYEFVMVSNPHTSKISNRNLVTQPKGDLHYDNVVCSHIKKIVNKVDIDIPVMS